MKQILILAFFIFAVATFASAFLMALSKQINVEQTGFFHRWIFFAWHNCIPVGIVVTALFLFLNLRHFSNY